MTASSSTTDRTLPRPIIDLFEGDDQRRSRFHQQLHKQVFTARPCDPYPGQPVVQAILVAELRSES